MITLQKKHTTGTCRRRHGRPKITWRRPVDAERQEGLHEKTNWDEVKGQTQNASYRSFFSPYAPHKELNGVEKPI